MTVVVSHVTVATLPNDPTKEVSSDAWNEDHDVAGLDTIPGLVPVGAIIMWSGTIATIPSPTWELCDGTANAPGPDLRDRFVVGATADDGGVAKSNVEGSLQQSGGVTGHLHSAHGNLTHAGITIADHTGLTHSLAIANHPDLTHAALSHAAITFTHADHAVASVSHTHAAITLTHADHSVASFSGTHASGTFSVPSGTFSVPSGTFSVPSGTFASHTHASSAVGQASLTLSISSAGTARTIMTGSSVTVPSFSGPSGTVASSTGTVASSTGTVASSTGTVASGTHTHGAITITHADHSVASFSGTHAATTLTHADHSFPSLSHQAIGTHTFAAHAITQPADHGTAGTLTHSFSQPDDHAVSAHDTVSNVNPYFALAFIQRMA